MTKLLIATAAIYSLFLAAPSLRAQIQGGWVNTGNLDANRESGAQVTLANGKALVGGGSDGTNILASAELYTPSTGAWTITASMATARQSFSAVVLQSGKVLVVGGIGANNTVLAAAELYDPVAARWSPAGKLAVARFAHSATLLQNGHVLVAGGCTTDPCGTPTADSELYDPVSNTWSTTGTLITHRAYHTATLLANGEVLVAGGTNSGTNLKLCELYNPSTKVWFNAPSMAYPRTQHAATLLSSGKVLVTGGYPPGYVGKNAEIYDQVSNVWNGTGIMVTARFAHTATLLTDSTVLIAAGEVIRGCGRTICYGPTSSAEIYTESTGKFTATGTLNHPRYLHTVSVLKDGQVLIAGGANNTGLNNSAELYTPLTLKFSSTSLNFGFEEVGITSPPQTVTVSNVSLHSANFSSIAASGDFHQTNNCTPTLLPSKTCTITVTFKPTTTGSRNGGVTLKDDCPGSPQQTISLAGMGSPYGFGISPTTLNFPPQLPGTSSAPMDVTVTNDGTGPVSVTVSISPADGAFTQTNDCPASLSVHTSCTVKVVFTPPDSIGFSATLSVADAAHNTLTAALSGSGID